MARRRLQQKGDLYQQGGWWKLRWHVYTVGAQKPKWSRPVIIGPAPANPAGMPAWTKRQAQRESWDKFLSQLDRNTSVPMSVMTVAQFVERVYIPQHVMLLRRREHKRSMLKWILRPERVDRIFGIDRTAENPRRKFTLKTIPGWPYLDETPLRDVTVNDCQRIVLALIEAGKSSQTIKHIRNVLSGIFTEAKRVRCFAGENPAAGVRLPPHRPRRPTHALTWDQALAVLEKLAQPTHDMALLSMLLSMNIAEICGLCWKHINLSDQWGTIEGEALPPWTVAVRQQFYRGSFGPLKHGSRRRNVEIPEALVPVFRRWADREASTGPDDPVFASRNGRPLDEHNYAKRHLKPVGRALDMPWLSWHVFRHTHATLTKIAGMSDADRMRMMGHSSLSMTDRYTHEDQLRRRAVLNQIADKLIGAARPQLKRVG